jgi:hypothetical protein
MKRDTDVYLFSYAICCAAVGWRKCFTKTKSTAAMSRSTVTVGTTHGGIYCELLHTTSEATSHRHSVVVVG